MVGRVWTEIVRFGEELQIVTWCSYCLVLLVVLLCYYRDETGKLGGELMLGGSDPTHYTTPLRFVDLAAESYWLFKMDE